MKQTKQIWRMAFLLTLPILAGYVFLGFAFGLLMKNAGYPVWYPVLMSVAIYSGALEYAAVPMLAQPFDPFGAFVFGLLLSARHLFYGLPMLEKYRNAGKCKPFLLFGLTDETFSLLTTVQAPYGTNPTVFYTAVTLLNYSYWVAGTALGAVCGELLTVSLDGLDFALTALFLVLFLEQCRDRTGKISGSIGLAVTFAVFVIFGTENTVVLAMAGILGILCAGKRVICRE